jgi:hypothetical protein
MHIMSAELLLSYRVQITGVFEVCDSVVMMASPIAGEMSAVELKFAFLITQEQSLELPLQLQHQSSPHYPASISQLFLTIPMSLVHFLPSQPPLHSQQPQLLCHALARLLLDGDVAEELSIP